MFSTTTTRTLPKRSVGAVFLTKSWKRAVLPFFVTRLRDSPPGTRCASTSTCSNSQQAASQLIRGVCDTTKGYASIISRSSSLPADDLSRCHHHTCNHPQRYFDSQYCERVVLSDGSRATMRLVRPTDHDLWVDGFSRLSPHSRYLRFCAAKKRLTEKEIRYFTVLDHESHFAILAVREDPVTEEVGLGVARFIRSNVDPARAEPAITVTDDAQSHGLGTVLALRLAAAAKERGIEYFDSSVLGSNDKVIRLIRDIAPSSTFRRYGSDTVISTKLPDIDPQESWLHLHELPQEQHSNEYMDNK
mmetsp:Transcript_10838/g.22940  ORF Transcript_10838/g.22940 Transcript_10838/m.22940 type:complete len:303 (-) Transcript_10838:91-999(-)